MPNRRIATLREVSYPWPDKLAGSVELELRAARLRHACDGNLEHAAAVERMLAERLR